LSKQSEKVVSSEVLGPTGSAWPHLDALLAAGGHVTLGHVEPFEGVAIAANTREVFAVLRRLPEERADKLIQRLEAALSNAARGGERVNEVGPAFGLARPSVRKRRG
jgi:hypothetical protein